ncbi:NUDIX domain-containing protein [Demequina globuliformis]|uniref:NUDIX domain-containing protein n=1 Tax=Demequina globuliformis TaxID=676202 RepID=UPI000782EEAF|nr:NUDIX hydrolase [Demequina globuliformis]
MDRLSDTPREAPVVSRVRSFTGKVWDIDSDDVDLGDGVVVTRDYVRHTGAVAIMALNDRNEIYLVHQYRHPVRAECWEPPAGLMDIAGEDALGTAQRELWEEADLTAQRWDVLVDAYTSPGGSSEAIRIFLARDIAEVPERERHVREHEEAQMSGAWVPLQEVIAAVMDGRVHSPTIVMGALALNEALRADGATLRPAQSAWDRPPSRE